MSKHTINDLYQMQALPLEAKVSMTKRRVQEWVDEFGEDGVYVAFSGGKDSTVLLHICREIYPNMKAVFVDTGLEYPEIREFVRSFDNVDWIKPKMTFKQVIEKYGYPFISKEVSECVYGARKYLTKVMEENSLDRPTDRPTDRSDTNTNTRNCSESDNTVPIRDRETVRNRTIQYQFETEKLLGIGRYGKPSRQLQSIEGGARRDFGNLCGIRTVEGSYDPRLWEGYRQFSGSETDGDSSKTGESNDGDYP